MKQIYKNSFKILSSLTFVLFLVFIFKTGCAYSIYYPFSLENVDVASKSDTLTEVADPEVKENKILSNSVKFHKVGDYITYSVKIKNNKSENYILKSITDDNKNEYISYDYDEYYDTKLNSGESFDFIFTETYSKELEDISQRNQVFSVNFYLTFETEDGNTTEEKIVINNNPDTSDSSNFYIMILVIMSAISIYVLMKTKNKKFFILFMGIYFIFSPYAAKSLEKLSFNVILENNIELKDKLIISLDINGNVSTKVVPYNTKAYISAPNIEGYIFEGWQTEDGSLFEQNSPITDDINLKALLTPKSDNYATLIKGSRLNVMMKKFAGNDDAQVGSVDNEIISVVRSFDLPSEDFTTDMHIVSTEDSPNSIYMWYDNNAIYYYSEADYIYLNPISESVFEKLAALKNIDFNDLRTEETINMSKMFYGCTSMENLNLSNFHTENVTTMFGMFSDCKSLQNLDLRSFNTSQVTDMSSMFNQCNSAVNINVSNFDTSKVKDMNRMFTACTSLESLNLSGFKTNNVTNMEKMFDNIPLIHSLDLSSFETNNVKKMNGMFRNCVNLNTLDLKNFNTSKVNTMEQMFYNCSNLISLNLSEFDTSNVTNMASMFTQCHSMVDLDLSGFNTHNVTDMSNIFNQCNSLALINVNNFDTGLVKNMNHMFSSCNSVQQLDVSGFDTRSVTNMEKMFDNMTSLTTIYASETFSVNNVINGSKMFMNDNNLVGGNGTAYDPSHVGAEYAHIDVTESPGYFTKRSD